MIFNSFPLQSPNNLKRFVLKMLAAVLVLFVAWMTCTAFAQPWQDNLGSYADSNPLLIPGGTSAVSEWKSYE